MRILIVYGTAEGQTKKIAEFIESELTALGHLVVIHNAMDIMLNPSGYDIVFIGASMHMEKYPASIEHYLNKYHIELNRIHSVFYSVSLTAASDDAESWKELKEATTKFISTIGWKPFKVEYFAGALRFTQYDFMKKFIMRQIAKKAGQGVSGDTEYTDWAKVKRFVLDVLEGYGTRPVNVGPELTDEEIMG